MKTPPRVLIADDNAANLRIMRTRLTADGYEVVTAADGEEALAVAHEAKPDLILLDIMMPKVDGIEVCRTLKKQQNPSFVPIILVTAMADAKDIVAGLEAGDDVLRVRHCGHEDDRREGGVLDLLQPAADLDTVDLRHHDVEQDQVGLRVAGDRKRVRPVARGDDVVAVGREAHFQDADVGGVVVGDQDARRSPHLRPSGRP